MPNENTTPTIKHTCILRKACPACGAEARAEARLPISAGMRPAEIDIDQPAMVGEQLGVGQMLALIEVIPYKLFRCRNCRHEFKLASQVAKSLLIGLLGSMQPVAPAPKQNASKTKPATKKASSKPAKTGPGQPSDDGWEPLSIDPA